jgi:DNA-binding response OmpR family regulator
LGDFRPAWPQGFKSLASDPFGAKIAPQKGKMRHRTKMKHHILVVDDEQQIRELLCLYLEKYGYQASAAATSAEAFELMKDASVDLVVLDIGLAHEDGLKVLERVKSAHQEVPVIMLTGMGFVEDLLQEAHEKGADGYVSKVLPLDELLSTIQRTLGSCEAALARN